MNNIHKIICIYTVIVLVLFLPVPIYAVGENSYMLDKLGMSVSLPADYIVFTRDINAADPNLSAYGLTKEDLSALMVSNSIYLNAWDENFNHEIIITMTDSSISDFNIYSDTELSAYADSAAAEYQANGVTLLKHEMYRHKQAKFLKIYIKRIHEDNDVYGLQYNTVYDNKVINITMQSYTGQFSASDEAELKNIIESVTFNTGPQTLKIESTGDFTAEYLVVNLLITVVVYSLPIFIYRYTIRKKPVEPRKAKIITFVYGVFALILMSVIIYALGGDKTAGGAILLWSYVNYLMLIKGRDETEEFDADEPNVIISAEEHRNENRQLSALSYVKAKSNMSIHEPQVLVSELSSVVPIEKKKPLCKLCGEPIDTVNLVCTGCGKKYVRRKKPDISEDDT